jgi:uncharacterized protein (DUF1778 family)
MYGIMPYIIINILFGSITMPVTRKKAANVATHRAKVARLEARITVEQKQFLERAADLQGRSLTEFVVNSAQEAARAAISEHELMSLTARDTNAFVNALLKPPSPGKRLQRAAARYKAIMEG